MEEALEVGREPGGLPSLRSNINMVAFFYRTLPGDFVVHTRVALAARKGVTLFVCVGHRRRVLDGRWIMSVFLSGFVQ